MVSAILLAAGESRRMGDFKQLLPVAGKTFIEHCVDNLLASRASEVIVVTGHRADDVQSAICDRPVKITFNPDYKIGMSESIKRGVAALSNDAQAVLVALVDQPQIMTEIFNRVIEEYEKRRPLLVVPTYGGRNGHPIILDLKLRDEILAMDSSQGLRQVVHSHEDHLTRIEMSNDVLIDFDWPEDYRRISGGFDS